MATISENLEALKTAKTDIKSAIEGKGQDLTNVPFTEYSEKIANIQTKEDLDAELTEQDALLSDLKSQVDNLPDREIDVSKTTATTEDVLQGKKFYNAQGEFVDGSYVSVSKLPQFISGDNIEITASDLAGINKIRESAFYYYRNNLTITLPNTITSIEKTAFYYTKSINIFFEENSQLNTIKSGAFQRSEIKSIVIPKSLVTMESYAFYECRYLYDVKFEQDCQLKSIPSYAFYNMGIENYSNPPEIIDLSTCTQLSSMESNAFGYAKVYNMILPSSITTIRSNALSSALQTLTVLATTPPSLEYNIGTKVTVYIPKGTLSAYQSATNWSASNLVELEA